MMSVAVGGLLEKQRKLMLHAKVLSENPNHTPTEEEIRLYASSIGIDTLREPDLLYIAKEGVSASIPKDWQVLQDENNHIFYYNNTSGQSLWEHPLDAYYRKKVEQARLRRPQARNTGTVVPALNASPRHTLVSTTVQDTGRSIPSQQTSTPAAASAERKQIIYPADWINAPLLGEDNSVDKGQFTSLPLASGSENDMPTEYRELTPSAYGKTSSKTLSLCHSTVSQHAQNNVVTHTTASQTDENEVTTTQQSTPKTGTGQNVTPCDLTLLQTKLRASFRSNREYLSPAGPKGNGQQRSLSLFDSPKRPPLNPLRNLDNTPPKHQRQPIQQLERPHQVDRRFSRLDNHAMLTLSPASKPTETSQLPSCPELGESPTASKADRPLGVSVLSMIREHPISPEAHTFEKLEKAKSTSALNSYEHSHKPSPSYLPPDSTAPTLSIRRSLLVQQPLGEEKEKTTPEPRQESGFNEGLSHLIEERARLQRKMLRIKLIYKTYKQRLASLDASLNILQQRGSTAAIPTATTPTVAGQGGRTPKPSQNRHILSAETHGSPGDSPSSDSVFAHHAQNDTNEKLEVVDIREGPIRSFSPGVKSSTTLRKPYRSLSVTRHTAPSWSSPFTKYTPSTVCQPSTRDTTGNSSGGGELAYSLASIDAQLHYVMHQLESSDTSAMCDRCVHEKHARSSVARRSVTPTAQLQSRNAKLNQLHYGLTNLSLHDPVMFERKPCMTDLRLLTPVSPDNERNGYQKPYLDGSPTWLNSD